MDKKESIYCIADLSILVYPSRSLNGFFSEKLAPFRLSDGANFALQINSGEKRELVLPTNYQLHNGTEQIHCDYIAAKQETAITIRSLNGRENIVASADREWREVNIFSDFPIISPLDGSIGEVIFRNFIIGHNGLVIHAAAIQWEGQGILFSAPAGTGKTTQANLWRKHMGAQVLNGDRPAVRVIDGQVWAYGTPWSGSSQDFLNEKAPLRAIVLPEQGTNNRAYRLSPGEAVPQILPRCFLPYWDARWMEKAIDTLDTILSKIPVYRLICRPDVGAVDALRAVL